MPLTLPIDLTPEEQATLLATASAQGITVEALLRKAIIQILPPAQNSIPQPQLRGEEIERAFEELADLIPESVPPLSNDNLRRENLYSREDDW